MGYFFVLLVIFVIRILIGGEPFGAGFWIAAGILLVVYPLLQAVLRESFLDPEEMEFHREFVRDQVPVLKEVLREWRSTGAIPEGRFYVTAAKRDRRYLTRKGMLKDLERIEAESRNREEEKRGREDDSRFEEVGNGEYRKR